LLLLAVGVLSVGLLCLQPAGAFAQSEGPGWHLVYTRSHRASFVQEWKYSFPSHQSARWIIAVRYPPELAWSRDVTAKAELLTSSGWKPLSLVTEGSAERRRMFVIDYPHKDPMLWNGFTLRTSFAATIYSQRLKKGNPAAPVAPLSAAQKSIYLAATPTFDFHTPSVRAWMDEHGMWKGKTEKPLAFVHRVYKTLRLGLPYNMAEGGPWICSQILKVGFGECCRHGVVGTSILRANGIPARTVCSLWAVDEKSQGAHCWGEFFLDGVGWVPYDTTLDHEHPESEAYFAVKDGHFLAGMVDFDWVINAGPFGKQSVFAIDAFPAHWSVGIGDLGHPKMETNTHVSILKRSR
jgi:hypothetical protein